MTGRIIVCGSRSWHDRQIIYDVLSNLLHGGYPLPTIVHGDARGADRIADEEARKLGYLTEPHPADWEHYGRRAGIARNEEMASLGADLCIAFWDGKSTGTAHMMDCAKESGIPVEVVRQ